MLFLSLNMKIIFSVEVQELLAHSAVFLLTSESLFGGVWTRNVFALNYLLGAQFLIKLAGSQVSFSVSHPPHPLLLW